MASEKFHKTFRNVIMASPLVGAGLASLLPLTDFEHQFLVLITLLWFQAVVLIEAFSTGK